MICRNCKQEFTIEPEDFEFYEKLDVPSPTWCPDCRYMRRLVHRNERTLYKRTCSATNKDIISIYPQQTPFPVYNQSYWENDNWDPLEYGKDYDFSRPFFEQFKELQSKVPRINLRNFESVNSEYTNQCERNKDCYLLVASSNCENVLYSNWAQYSKDTLDIYNVLEGEMCYEVINAQKVNRVFYSMFVENSFDCWFSYDLKGCNNCFLSSNLRNKSYYWRNKPVPKEEYEKRCKEIETGSYKKMKELKDEWQKVKKDAIHKYARVENTIESSGDMLFECKNVHRSFNMSRAEDCRYCQDGLEMKDCIDNTEVAFKFEQSYEAHGSAGVARSRCINICWESHSLNYCDLCRSSHDLFGCISLKHKEYCILNKQHTKEEYEVLLPRIIEHMKTTGEWGEFFPIETSVFSYNETTANEYFPLEREEVVKKKWKWQDTLPGTKDQGTVKMETLPDHVKDIQDNVISDILTCIQCGKNYRILKQELELYKKFNIPIPRLCPNCRHYERLKLRNPRKLWKRECGCKKSNHLHGVNGCKTMCETTYVPSLIGERPEVIFCKECYENEVV